uniref:Circadianly regulated protein n=2 Tax=Drosophila melanogaster TaxID=7227 RepID=Q8IRT6_DROME|nr:circadianly regulated gene [Drosophila melanogaster]AAN09106.1 circadianly regulated gene [Drosophila melanogaster]|eukprot:NP_726887.1 circadianly regulated gene [Drosophila melanogaster]
MWLKSKTNHRKTSRPKKPPFTYTELIEYALEDKGELTVSGIYQWISHLLPPAPTIDQTTLTVLCRASKEQKRRLHGAPSRNTQLLEMSLHLNDLRHINVDMYIKAAKKKHELPS